MNIYAHDENGDLQLLPTTILKDLRIEETESELEDDEWYGRTASSNCPSYCPHYEEYTDPYEYACDFEFPTRYCNAMAEDICPLDLMDLPWFPGDILDEAKAIVYGERSNDYGTPERAFGSIADIWNVQLQDYLKKPIEPHMVAELMCGLKLARQSKNPKRDNMVDLAGYAALAQIAIDNE